MPNRTKLRWFIKQFVVFSIVLCIAHAHAHADVIVVATDVPSYKRGQILQDTDVIDIPQGSRITVLLSSNAIREIKGPFREKVADLSKGRPSAAESLWQQVRDFFSTGGTSTSPGATRSFSAPGSPGAAPPARNAWKAVPLDVRDAACITAGQPVKLGRKDARNALDVRLSDTNMTGIATVSFLPGQAEAAWPTDIPSVAGSYILTIPALAPKRFSLKSVEPASLEGDRVLDTLAREGCQAQVQLWLQSASAE